MIKRVSYFLKGSNIVFDVKINIIYFLVITYLLKIVRKQSIIFVIIVRFNIRMHYI